MGILLIKIVIIVNLIFLFLYFVLPKKKWHTITGTFEDMIRHLDILQKSDLPDASLIISIPDTEDFIQLTNAKNGFQLNYAVLDDRQKEMEKKLKRYAEKMDLKVTENCSDDNKSTFLDIDLDGSPEDVCKIVKGLLISAFEAAEDAKLEFEVHA